MLRPSDSPTSLVGKTKENTEQLDELARAQNRGSEALRNTAGHVLTLNPNSAVPHLVPQGSDTAVQFYDDELHIVDASGQVRKGIKAGTANLTEALVDGDIGATGAINTSGGLYGTTNGAHLGDSTGGHYGDQHGNSYGNCSGTHYGAQVGDVQGNTFGGHYGDVHGALYGDATGGHFGDQHGNCYGTLTGDSYGLHVGGQVGDCSGGINYLTPPPSSPHLKDTPRPVTGALDELPDIYDWEYKALGPMQPAPHPGHDDETHRSPLVDGALAPVLRAEVGGFATWNDRHLLTTAVAAIHELRAEVASLRARLDDSEKAA